MNFSYVFRPLCIGAASLCFGTICVSAQITVDKAIPPIASIRVDTSSRGHTIPRTIFGTFLEPIGNSTYNGLWAELLRNPSLEAGLFSVTTIRAMVADQPELARASELAVPLPWEPSDETQGNRYEVRYGDAANSYNSLELLGLPGKNVGIRQRVYLPAQRELAYTASLYARRVNGPATIRVSLRKRNQPSAVLATADIDVGTTEWAKYSVHLKLDPGQVESLEPSDFAVELIDASSTLVDQISLMPDDNLDGLDPEVVAMVRDLHTPLIRFGGNFTSGYHWKDGVGPRDKRVSMLNAAWGIPELNTFGTDEFLHFCDLVMAKPQIALNLGSGSPDEAAAWVTYVDKTAKWNGRGPGQIWELGNELWGSWNTGWPTLEQLPGRTADFSSAIRAADPSAKLIATGQDPDVYTKWNAAQLSSPPGTFDYLSTHLVLTTDNVRWKNATDEFRAQSTFAVPAELERRFAAMTGQIKASPSMGKAKIAFTEWLWVGHRYDYERQVNQGGPTPVYDNFAGALGTACVFNMLLRSSDLVPVSDMTGVLEFAGIWKRRGVVYGTPASKVFQTFAGAPIDHLLTSTTESGEYSVHDGTTRLPEIAHVPYLDVTATGSADGRTVTIFVVNRSLSQDILTDLAVKGARKNQLAEVVRLESPALFERNSEEHPSQIVPTKSTAKVGEKFRFLFPAATFTRIRFPSAHRRPDPGAT